MILQKFVSTISIINSITDECFDENYTQFLFELLDTKMFTEIDSLLVNIDDKMSKNLELLSTQTSIDDCFKIIKEFSLNEKFSLSQYLSIAVFYSDFHIERLPMFPLERIPFNFFAYLELAHKKLHDDCYLKGVSMAEKVFDLSLDNFEKQNI